jgi:hypothetical protein
MYATIRRYTAKNASKAKFDELKQRIEDGFVPVLREVRGFHGYYVLNVNNKELVTISLFDDKTGAQESTRRAADFVKKDPMKDQLGAPEVIEGDLLISKEGAVAAAR